ncbi:hypothetical protein KO516_16540 [Citreicella sp. C3M06]|uniref:hypothetical protein n=1 Tax=Citreicella sp. C3M06 TaxID=2841564 RepID=UPI001C08F4A2|nr:hypothetical protein [Citreicella sp. C3M06]MBU2962399.1 hypothetical protein [Citreicella sp. C3M06]
MTVALADRASVSRGRILSQPFATRARLGDWLKGAAEQKTPRLDRARGKVEIIRDRALSR